MNRRNEASRAVRVAAQILASSAKSNRTSFDIVGAITTRGIPLVFRPLDRLWGAFIATGGRTAGIIVNSRLGLAVQRFTLAHELGHLLLGHQSSLDETVGFAGRHWATSRAAAEVAADTFALELLASRQLVMEAAKRHDWNRQKLRQPDIIYQLSLHLGITYQATCWGLVTARVLTVAEAKRLHAKPLKELKRALAPKGLITDSWADVWTLTAGDAGTFIEAGPDDLFAVQLQDRAFAGYVWTFHDTGVDAEIVNEGPAGSDQMYGRPLTRVVYVRFRSPGTHRLAFKHTRPWSGATLDHIEIHVDAHGKESEGLPRRTKLDALTHAG